MTDLERLVTLVRSVADDPSVTYKPRRTRWKAEIYPLRRKPRSEDQSDETRERA